MKKYSHIIWDFNGTILDDIDIGIESINALLSRRGMKTICSVEEYRRHFRFPIVDYYKSLGLDANDFDRLAVEWVNEYNSREHTAKIYDGVIAALDFFKAKNYTQVVLSATEKKMLTEQLERLSVLDRFDDIVGLSDIKAYSKVEAAKIWFDFAKPDRAVIIGDTVHDFEVASAVGADIILVSQGHHAKAMLENCGCPVVDSLFDVIKMKCFAE